MQTFDDMLENSLFGKEKKKTIKKPIVFKSILKAYQIKVAIKTKNNKTTPDSRLNFEIVAPFFLYAD